jgi:hypothetical protein
MVESHSSPAIRGRDPEAPVSRPQTPHLPSLFSVPAHIDMMSLPRHFPAALTWYSHWTETGTYDRRKTEDFGWHFPGHRARRISRAAFNGHSRKAASRRPSDDPKSARSMPTIFSAETTRERMLRQRKMRDSPALSPAAFSQHHLSFPLCRQA